MKHFSQRQTSSERDRLKLLWVSILTFLLIGATAASIVALILDDGTSGLNELLVVTITASVGGITAILISRYLRKASKDDYDEIDSGQISRIRARLEHRRLEQELSRSRPRLTDVNEHDDESDDTKGDEIDRRIRQCIEEYIEREVLVEEVMDTLEKKTTNLRRLREIERVHSTTRRRIRSELQDVQRRGQLNLTIGSVFAVVGILFLGLSIALDLFSGASLSVNNIVPRMSFVVVVELFAYFFLRLYGATMNEIRFFQNELTNVESKYVALRTAMDLSDKKTTNKVISEFAQTERNYVPQKVQAIGSQRSKKEQETLASLIEAFLTAGARRR